MKSKNPQPVVEMNPTKYKGGLNKSAMSELVMNPTRYKGGLNKAATNVPKKK